MRFLYRLLHTRTTTCVLLVRRLRRGGVPLRTSTLKRLVFLLLAACVLLYGSLIRALLKQQLLPPPLGPAVVTPAPYWSHKVGGVRESSFEQRPPYHGGWAVRQRCRRPLDVLVFVMSEPREWARRAALRDTLFEEASLRRLNWSAVFFTRRCAADELVDAWLDVEASATGDLVLFSVDEVLGAASYTWVAAMRWVADHCPTVPRILMLDDDSLVQPDQVLRYFEREVELRPRYLHCAVRESSGRSLETGALDNVSLDDFPGDKFFPHCSGHSAIMTFHVMRDLLRAASRIRGLSKDDAYVTGYLALVQNIGHAHIDESLEWNPDMPDCLQSGACVFTRHNSTYGLTTGRRGHWGIMLLRQWLHDGNRQDLSARLEDSDYKELFLKIRAELF